MYARVVSRLAVSFLMSSPLFPQTALPSVHDGLVLSGPGEFLHEGELFVQGRVTLRNLTLHLAGPIRVAEDATLEFDNVHLLVSDPEGAPNGTSGLRCEGPAHIIIRQSTMTPLGSAHPMWLLKGELDLDGFATTNSEFHLDHVRARLNRLKIFELEMQWQSSELGEVMRELARRDVNGVLNTCARGLNADKRYGFQCNLLDQKK